MRWGRFALVLRTLACDFLDAVAAPHAHTGRTNSRRAQDIPLRIRQHELLGTRITTLMEYRRPEVQDLIRSLKYDGNAHAAALCASVVADFLHEELSGLRAFSARPVFIIPLPLHRDREASRGFNQITRALRLLPASFRDGRRAQLSTEILVRTRDTPHQTSLSRRERIANMRDAFTVADARSIRHAHVFVIDDVATTGATLANAGRSLERAGADVTLIALARA